MELKPHFIPEVVLCIAGSLYETWEGTEVEEMNVFHSASRLYYHDVKIKVCELATRFYI